MLCARVDLVPHPRNPRPAPDIRIAAQAARTARGCDLRYTFAGEVAGIAWPTAAAPERREGLWRHTCVEAFFATPGDSRYFEFNFSPSTEWAAFSFAGYRERGADPGLGSPPLIRLVHGERDTLIEVSLDLAGLPCLAAPAPVDVALTAVVEDRGGGLHHFAPSHPAGPADFHDRRGFVLTLAGYRGPAA